MFDNIGYSGIYVTNSTPSITNSEFTNCSIVTMGAINCINDGDARLSQNYIHGNTGVGLYVSASDPHFNVSVGALNYFGDYSNQWGLIRVDCDGNLYAEGARGNDVIYNGSQDALTVGGYQGNIVNAEWVYWGENMNYGKMFNDSTLVDYIPYLDNSVSAYPKPAFIQDDIVSYFEDAERLKEMVDYAGAMTVYKNGIAKDPSNLRSKGLLSGMFWIAIEHLDIEELRIYLKELSQQQSHLSIGKKASRFVALSFVLEGRYQDAINEYQSIFNDSNRPDWERALALLNIERVYVDNLGDMASANNICAQVEELLPNSEIAYEAQILAGKDVSEYIPEQEQKKVENTEQVVEVFPNPFNPVVTITYSISKPENVIFEVYSVTGQKVATLINGFVQAGTHSVRFDASNLASGVYFYRLKTPSFSKTGKMLMVR